MNECKKCNMQRTARRRANEQYEQEVLKSLELHRKLSRLREEIELFKSAQKGWEADDEAATKEIDSLRKQITAKEEEITEFKHEEEVANRGRLLLIKRAEKAEAERDNYREACNSALDKIIEAAAYINADSNRGLDDCFLQSLGAAQRKLSEATRRTVMTEAVTEYEEK